MSQSNKHKHNPSSVAGGSKLLKTVAAVVAVGIIAAIVVMLIRPEPTPELPAEAAPTDQPTPATSTNAAPAAVTDPEFQKLKGQWQRPDGGYVIEVTAVETNGSVAAAYYNPRPIRVSRAEARRVDGTLKVFVELQGQGYPGSTYTLTYLPQRDELEGVYFQAAMGEYYDVVFTRMK